MVTRSLFRIDKVLVVMVMKNIMCVLNALFANSGVTALCIVNKAPGIYS